MDNKLIYIVDDEKNIRDLIKAYLDKEGFETKTFSNGKKVLDEFNKKVPDMVIMDIMMPEINGYDLCKEIRKKHNMPLIMVSAKDEEFDRILGLELGSDDYLTKPFSPRELTVRVKNIFKRIELNNKSEETPSENIKVRDIVIKTSERSVYRDNTVLDITSKEYELLLLLCKRKNQAFSRDMIIDSIWGYGYIGDTRPVDDLVKRLRKKLKAAESTLEIKSVWGYGYKVME